MILRAEAKTTGRQPSSKHTSPRNAEVSPNAAGLPAVDGQLHPPNPLFQESTPGIHVVISPCGMAVKPESPFAVSHGIKVVRRCRSERTKSSNGFEPRPPQCEDSGNGGDSMVGRLDVDGAVDMDLANVNLGPPQGSPSHESSLLSRRLLSTVNCSNSPFRYSTQPFLRENSRITKRTESLIIAYKTWLAQWLPSPALKQSARWLLPPG